MKRATLLHSILCVILIVWSWNIQAQVVVNQIMYDTPWNEQITSPPYSNGEFLELYNYSAEDVQLYGWQVKGGGKTEIFTFDSIILPAHQYLIIAYRHKDTPTFTLDSMYNASNVLSNVRIVYQRKIVLSNSGESVSVWDNLHNKVDSIFYDGTSNKRKEDRLSADNQDAIPYNTCVALQRNNITYVNNAVVARNADWITNTIGINTNIPTLLQGVDAFYYTPTANTNASGHNYILSVVPLDATDTVLFHGAQVQLSDNARAAVSITYYDGLGRPIQQNHLRATPLGKDIVSQTDYDGLSKVSHQWIPTPLEDNHGAYTDSLAFATNAKQFHNSTYPFVSTHYEQSTLHRPNAQQRAGDAWRNKQQNIRYRLNAENEVLRFEVLNETTLVCKGYYGAAQLQQVITRDEDNKSTTTYTDKQGRTIMQKVGDDVCTYYVYNFLGQLAYVLPPALATKLTNGNYTDSHEWLKQYAYLYKYDARGNCILKRLPGCDPLYMVYDAGGRLVQTQDGNQRARGHYWTVCKYDQLNRIVYTAEVLTSSSNLQAEVENFKDWNVWEEFFTTTHTYPMEDTGYSRGFYHNSPTKLLTVNYYDSYDFLTLLPDATTEALTFEQRNGYDAAVLSTAKLHGRLTGTRTYNLTDNTYTVTANYYDLNGRLIQQRSTNLLGGTNHTYLSVDFTGNILRQLTTHTTNSNSNITEHYTYTYDATNRLTTTIYKQNDDAPMMLNHLQYDELGRLKEKQLYDAIDAIQYEYNIQNWVTSIKSADFEEKIYYTQPAINIPGVVNNTYFNGNISATTWTYQGQTNGYIYDYDNKNRFTAAYGILDSVYSYYHYSESMTYDKSGNITQLTRWDNHDAMNHLQYTYNGNQITKVTDQGYAPVDYACKRYMDLADEAQEMGYDANGNLIYDLDRQIVAIRYNILNLPDTVQFKNGSQIINYYDALGTRTQTTYRTRKVATTVPLGTTLAATNNLSDYTILTHAMDKNMKYVASGNGALVLDYVFNSEGYYRNSTNAYFYYIRDHLGNIRETYVYPWSNYKECVQQMQYYPSGLPWNDTWGAIEHSYRYNGKEFVEMHGYDTYDYGFRGYYPALGRFTSVDLLAENHYNTTSYAYCVNNPISYIDLNGLDTIDVTYDTENETWVIAEPIIEEGDDVIVVHDEDGEAQSYTFSEGKYGERVIALNLENAGEGAYNLGVFHISGEQEKGTGFYLTPGGTASNKYGSNARVLDGTYSISAPEPGATWKQPGLKGGGVDARGVRFHYGTGLIWTEGCFILSTKYSLKNGSIKFPMDISQRTSWNFNQKLGAVRDTIYEVQRRNGTRTTRIGAIFPNPINYMLILKTR